jgi:hypothetical protein
MNWSRLNPLIARSLAATFFLALLALELNWSRGEEAQKGKPIRLQIIRVAGEEMNKECEELARKLVGHMLSGAGAFLASPNESYDGTVRIEMGGKGIAATYTEPSIGLSSQFGQRQSYRVYSGASIAGRVSVQWAGAISSRTFSGNYPPEQYIGYSGRQNSAEAPFEQAPSRIHVSERIERGLGERLGSFACDLAVGFLSNC